MALLLRSLFWEWRSGVALKRVSLFNTLRLAYQNWKLHLVFASLSKSLTTWLHLIEIWCHNSFWKTKVANIDHKIVWPFSRRYFVGRTKGILKSKQFYRMSITKSAFVILQNCILLTDGAGFLNPNFSNSNGITTIYILDESYLSTSCLVYYLLKDFSIPRFFFRKKHLTNWRYFDRYQWNYSDFASFIRALFYFKLSFLSTSLSTEIISFAANLHA